MSNADSHPPGPSTPPAPPPARFLDVGAVRSLREGGALTTVIDGRAVVVFRTGGQYRAVSNRCPHNGMALQDGCVRDNTVTCRWHGWQFDLTTGRTPGSDAGSEGPRIRVYPTRVEEGRILVGPSDGEASPSGESEASG